MRMILILLFSFSLAFSQSLDKKQMIGEWAVDTLLIQGMSSASDETNATVDNLLAFTFFTFSENEIEFSSMNNKSKGQWRILENKILWDRNNRTDTFIVSVFKPEQMVLEQYANKRKVNVFHLFPLKPVKSIEAYKSLSKKWKSKLFIPSSANQQDTLNEVFYKNSWANFDSTGACQITVGAVMVQGHFWINKSATRLVFKDLAGTKENMKLKIQNKSLLISRPKNAAGLIGSYRELEFFID